MFCPKCGAQIPDGAGFCSSCGNAVNATPTPAAPTAPAMDYQAQMLQAQMLQAQQFQMQKTAVRQSEISALTNAYNYFNAKRTEFQQYDHVCERLNHFSRGARSALMVWGIIILAFGAFMTLGAFSGEMPIAVPLFVFIFPGAAMLTGGILLKSNNKRQCAYYQGEYLRLSQELNDYYAAYPQCPVGAEYANPEILELILGVLNSGRADTIKEAINVLIAEANQAEMTAYLQNIQAYSEQASARAGAAAVFAAASFFS